MTSSESQPERLSRIWETRHSDFKITVSYNAEHDDMSVELDDDGHLVMDEHSDCEGQGLTCDRFWVATDDEIWVMVNYIHEDDTIDISVRQTSWSQCSEVTERKAELT